MSIKKYYLVSGATGSIGSEVMRSLLSKGHGVAAISRIPLSKNKVNISNDVIWAHFDYENDEIPLEGKDNPFFEILKNQKFEGSFHCAGAYHSCSPEDLDVADFSNSIKANLYSAINIIKYSLSTVNKLGSIIVLNSQASYKSSKNEVAYGTSKRALSAYLDGMQSEATKRKIQLVNVLSGAVKSTMVKDRDNYDDFIEPSELANLLVNISAAGSSIRIKDIELLRRNY